MPRKELIRIEDLRPGMLVSELTITALSESRETCTCTCTCGKEGVKRSSITILSFLNGHNKSQPKCSDCARKSKRVGKRMIHDVRTL